MSKQQGTKAVGAQVPVEVKQQIRTKAWEQSDEDTRVFVSDIVREALAEYLGIPLEELEP